MSPSKYIPEVLVTHHKACIQRVSPTAIFSARQIQGSVKPDKPARAVLVNFVSMVLELTFSYDIHAGYAGMIGMNFYSSFPLGNFRLNVICYISMYGEKHISWNKAVGSFVELHSIKGSTD